MEKATQGLQSVKSLMWNKYCDWADQSELQSMMKKQGERPTGSSDFPDLSLLRGVDPIKVGHNDCNARFDLASLDDCMRKANLRRTGLEAGDRLKPVNCPVCQEPMSDLTVQTLRLATLNKSLKTVTEQLGALSNIGIAEYKKYAFEGQPNEDNKPVIEEAKIVPTIRRHIAKEAEKLPFGPLDTFNMLARVLPDQLSAVALNQPKNLEFQDARNTTMALTTLSDVNGIVDQIQQSESEKIMTSLPHLLKLYELMSNITKNFENTAQSTANALLRSQRTENGQITRNDTAAQYVDDAYRATIMATAQFKMSVQGHMAEAEQYNALMDAARIGVEPADKPLSRRDQDVAESQWLAFKKAENVSEANTLLQNSAAALIEIANSVMTQHNAPAILEGQPADVAFREAIGGLSHILEDCDKLVETFKRREEDAANYAEAVKSETDRISGQLNTMTQGLALQVLAAIDPRASAQTEEEGRGGEPAAADERSSEGSAGDSTGSEAAAEDTAAHTEHVEPAQLPSSASNLSQASQQQPATTPGVAAGQRERTAVVSELPLTAKAEFVGSSNSTRQLSSA